MTIRRKKHLSGMTSANLLWWCGYIFVAIWLQKLLPGLDALVPALIICLQDGNKQQTSIFLLLCIIIQEGAGTLPFGGSIIWYSTVIAAYYVGGKFFMGGNIMFIIVLSVAMGISRALIFWGMGLLQPLPLDYQIVHRTYVLQILLTPLIWGIAQRVRNTMVQNAY